MKVLLQRVTNAAVEVESNTVGSIGQGLLLFVCLEEGDTSAKLKPIAEKVANLRVFAEGEKHFHLSLLETGFAALVVSQFTLAADLSKGRRPDFFRALKPELAKPLVAEFVTALRECGVKQVEEGIFGAYMQVSLENDGPVTLWLEG